MKEIAENLLNQKTHTFKILLILLPICLLAINTSNASGQAAEPQIELQVEQTYEGNFKYGEWLLLWVTLENYGTDADIEVFANIPSSNGNGIYAINVSLPAGGRKQVPLYILPNNYSREINIQAVSDGKEIASQIIEVSPNQNNYYLIGIASPETGPIAQIDSLASKSSSRKVISFNLSPNLLPEKSIALNSLDAIILNDTDTSQLSLEQKQALIEWVQAGGRLILGGGPGLEKTISGLPEELINFNIIEMVELEDLDGLQTYADNTPIQVNGPFTANQFLSSSGTSLAQQDEYSLVHEWSYGSGQINLISMDISASPFNAWSGTKTFWVNLLSPYAAFPLWKPLDTSIRQIRAGNMYYPLSNQPALDLPSIRGLAILLVFYIILVGPVNYLVLRRRKKNHLAWITIPALTALFTAGAFGLAFILRGNDILVNNISIINLSPDGSAKVTAYVGVFSPSQATYSLEMPGNPLLSPSSQGYYDPWSSIPSGSGGEARFIQGNPAIVTGLNVDQWALNSFNVEALKAEMGQIKTNLKLENGKLTGTIENQLPNRISGASLVFGDGIEFIGDLEPFETIEVEMNFSDLYQDEGFQYTYAIIEKMAWGDNEMIYSREFEQKRSILDAVMQPYGYWIGPPSSITGTQSEGQTQLPSFFLMGWMDYSPLELSLGNNPVSTKTLSLLTYHPGLEVDKNGFTLPPSTIPGKLISSNNNSGYCGGKDINIFLDNNEATVNFNIPTNFIPTNTDSLSLYIWDEMNWNVNAVIDLDVSIYNWENGTWQQYSEVINGVNVIKKTDGLISNDGFIQIKISKENNNSSGCVYLGMGLDGSLDD